ncbi:hypothetical protein [Haloferax larsenii]|uniref:Uncharacterized protein n=1 Tax=Haloferax larsenii TaxID=302484 RepID=A0A1H7R5T1_HALLR|nr:hypothetical protein [Haloferax larsenii]SEL55358.1 hypothetical protein SAMN04488691_105278 [Haloferax larsenii]
MFASPTDRSPFQFSSSARRHRFGRRIAARVRAWRRRRLVASAPRRRVADLDDVARATVVGTVAEVVGAGPALEAWTTDANAGPAGVASGRATRPFALEDTTGTVHVRIPPAGAVVGERGASAETTVECGDRLSVTGQVVRRRDGRWALTGPGFVLRKR